MTELHKYKMGYLHHRSFLYQAVYRLIAVKFGIETMLLMGFLVFLGQPQVDTWWTAVFVSFALASFSTLEDGNLFGPKLLLNAQRMFG